MPKELQRSILEGFWGPFESLLGVLLAMLEGLWLFLGIVWVQNGARSVKMRVLLGSGRGGQVVSEALNASILKRFSSLGACCWVLLHVVFRNVLNVVEAAPQARPKTT